MADYAFVKGHGTRNDFVLLPDAGGERELTAELAAALCDRRGGIGADGVIRVVRTDATDDPHAVAARGEATWFMDYRNADGSLSQMCGNGIRVLGLYLATHADVDPRSPLPVATRSGVKQLRFVATEDGVAITVDMGPAELLGQTSVGVGERTWSAHHVSTGNPHAVAFVEDLADAGDLGTEPTYDAAVYPEGVNVEFVVRTGERHLSMRVHERGSGETQSCGTGACAVAVAAMTLDARESHGSARPSGGDGATAEPADTAGLAHRADSATTDQDAWAPSPEAVTSPGAEAGAGSATTSAPEQAVTATVPEDAAPAEGGAPLPASGESVPEVAEGQAEGHPEGQHGRADDRPTSGAGGQDDAPSGVRGVPYTVDLPGGRLEITWTEDGRVLMTGPAALVAEGVTSIRA